MNFRGRVIDPIGAPGELSTFSAKFDATFTGLTPQDILDAVRCERRNLHGLLRAEGHRTGEQPPPTIPEPATMLTFGAGTALLAVHRRRRAKKAAK